MIRTTFILTICFAISCRPNDGQTNDKVNVTSDPLITNRQRDKLNDCKQLDDKVFHYLHRIEVPDHLFTLIFKCVDKGLTGKIFGPDPEGEHGLYFFKANLEKLKLDSLNNIEFEFSKGDLYTEIITMENYLDSLNLENAGSSHGQIYYKGKMYRDSIVFKCTSQYNDCFDKVMTFREN